MPHDLENKVGNESHFGRGRCLLPHPKRDMHKDQEELEGARGVLENEEYLKRQGPWDKFKTGTKMLLLGVGLVGLVEYATINRTLQDGVSYERVYGSSKAYY